MRIAEPWAAQPVLLWTTQYKAGEHGQDADCGDTEYSDFAEGVKGAEVDQNDVHHVGAATAGLAFGKVEGRNTVRRAGEHGVAQRPHASAGQNTERRIAATSAPTGIVRCRLRQIKHGQQEQDHGDDFNQ